MRLVAEMKSSSKVCRADPWRHLQGQKATTIKQREMTLTPHRDTGPVCLCVWWWRLINLNHSHPLLFASLAKRRKKRECVAAGCVSVRVLMSVLSDKCTLNQTLELLLSLIMWDLMTHRALLSSLKTTVFFYLHPLSELRWVKLLPNIWTEVGQEPMENVSDKS